MNIKRRRRNTSISVRKESSQEEIYVKEKLKIKRKKIIKRIKEEGY
jgi:phosphoribosyl-ATP pyrophosphohydrolase